MSNQTKEGSASESFETIRQSHQLSGDSRKLAGYYRGWAKSYNDDVHNERYCAPDIIADLFVGLTSQYFARTPENTTTLDAGCGTGLSGLALAQRGVAAIDGFDLSHEMVAEAKKTQVYRSLSGGVDMSRSLDGFRDDHYEATVCCGVFTVGHVAPESLGELLRVTKPGGMVLVSTRKRYAEGSGFDEYISELVCRRRMEILHCLLNRPYIASESAHYWAFGVL
ncbi:MAG: class I SAM-dependent DNA methyltransferase [Pseudonocardiaceae bacterium]